MPSRASSWSRCWADNRAEKTGCAQRADANQKERTPPNGLIFSGPAPAVNRAEIGLEASGSFVSGAGQRPLVALGAALPVAAADLVREVSFFGADASLAGAVLARAAIRRDFRREALFG